MKQAREYLKNMDKLFIALCLCCSVISVLALTSIAYYAADPDSGFFTNYRLPLVQGGAAILGIIASVIISTFDYQSIASAWPVHAGVSWGLVLLTFIIGYAPEGTTNQSWIQLPGGLSIQPTELAKISFILTFALHLDAVKDKMNEPKNLFFLMLHFAAPLLLIHIQGDDGTVLVFLLVGVSMLFAAGLDRKYIFAGVGVCAVALPLLWKFGLKDYQKERVYALFDPDNYTDIMWQQNQGRISIGAGQITGRGFFGVEHHTVPLAQNDFVFSYISESLGFVGSLFVLLLLFAIVVRLIADAFRSKDRLGAMICVGIAAVVGWQTVINVGMNLSLMPVIGITLPFFTAGGTSVLMLYMCMGLALSVYSHNKKTLFD